MYEIAERPDTAIARSCIQVELLYRLCTEADLPALEWMGLFTTHGQIIRTVFEQQQQGKAWMLLAVASGFPVAQVWIDVGDRGSIRCPRLWAMRVFPPLQSAGIGTQLMQHTESFARAQGATELEVGVEPDNARARRFYQRLGYRTIGHIIEPAEHEPEDNRESAAIEQELMRKSLVLAVCGE
jgi:GNAT superfamily N-acetyltransferase